jgi:signal transduction histidine kinase
MNQRVNFLGVSWNGEMPSRIASFNWAATSIGRCEEWPETLKTVLRVALCSHHPMLVWWGPDLIQFYNDAYRETLGAERHPGALGQAGRDSWREIWPVIGPQVESIMAGGPPAWHDDQLVPVARNSRRTDVWWTYGYSPIVDETGVRGVLVITNDVTEKHQAQQLKDANALLELQVLQRQRETDRLRELFQQAPGFMCILRGPRHIFELTNDAFMRLVGNRSLLNRPAIDALPEVEAQGLITLLDQVYETGEAYFARGVPLTFQRGPDEAATTVFVDFVYQAITDPDGTVSGIFVEGSDVTERRHANQKLMEADRRKDEFLAMLAHELRNPLAPISTAAELLRLGTPEHSRLRKASDVIARQVRHLSSLVDDLLDISRLSKGLISLSTAPLDFRDVVSDALEQVRPAQEARRHRLSVEVPPEPVPVVGDKKRLVQAVANLLSNAIKYTPSGGDIELRVEVPGDSVTLTVSDNGVGMAPETARDAFDLFSQAERTPDRSQGGLGIGLTIVKNVIELHGGTASARSDGLGYGSTFTINLPAAASC